MSSTPIGCLQNFELQVELQFKLMSDELQLEVPAVSRSHDITPGLQLEVKLLVAIPRFLKDFQTFSRTDSLSLRPGRLNIEMIRAEAPVNGNLKDTATAAAMPMPQSQAAAHGGAQIGGTTTVVASLTQSNANTTRTTVGNAGRNFKLNTRQQQQQQQQQQPRSSRMIQLAPSVMAARQADSDAHADMTLPPMPINFTAILSPERKNGGGTSMVMYAAGGAGSGDAAYGRLGLKGASSKTRAWETSGVDSPSTVHLMRLLKTWDRGSRSVRERILESFIESNTNKTGPQLEREFGNGASLFLARITSWLRLTYLLSYNLALQLRAISIFVSAASGHRFLAEFMEVGGILTVLEILGLSQVQETEKAEAIKLILSVANSGRKYKEFICESFGVRAVADCLAKSRSEITQDLSRNLLYQLGVVYKALLSLLTTAGSPNSQQMAGQGLRLLLPSIDPLHPSIIDATIPLLKSIYIQVQYEGYEILHELIKRPSLQESVLNHLVVLLKPAAELFNENQTESNATEKGRRWQQNHGGGAKGSTVNDEESGIGIDPSLSPREATDKQGLLGEADEVLRDDAEDADDSKDEARVKRKNTDTGKNGRWKRSYENEDDMGRGNEHYNTAFVQQAHAARLIGVMATTSKELAEMVIRAQAVSGLLAAIGNASHPQSQKNASSTLLYLAETFPIVGDALKKHMGTDFHEVFTTRPDTFYKELTRDHLKYLRRNTVRIHLSNDAVETEEDSSPSGSSDDDSGDDEADDTNNEKNRSKSKRFEFIFQKDQMAANATPGTENGAGQTAAADGKDGAFKDVNGETNGGKSTQAGGNNDKDMSLDPDGYKTDKYFADVEHLGQGMEETNIHGKSSTVEDVYVPFGQMPNSKSITSNKFSYNFAGKDDMFNRASKNQTEARPEFIPDYQGLDGKFSTIRDPSVFKNATNKDGRAMGTEEDFDNGDGNEDGDDSEY